MRTLALNQVPGKSKLPLPQHILAVLLFFTTFYSLWFLPALLRDQILGPGDGYIQSLPAYYAPRTLWTTQLLGGFPVAADVTPQTWYPISLLLSLFPHSWNAFVISSYVLASLFTYGYVYLITESVLASLVSGLTYGASGFMMSHLGHTSMIHTATWIPLTLLACEQILRTNRKIWLAILSIAIACLFLAGHPQISVYGLTLLISYAAFFEALTTNRWVFYSQFILTVILGIGLAFIQLLPTAELAQMTPRSAMSFSDFLAYSMPLSHAVIAVFPYILGGNTLPYKLPYIGVSSPTEITLYMGLLPLTLAWLGLKKSDYSSSFLRFWAVVGFISFLLILGTTTPMAWISYQIPVYNKFRILGRNAVVLAMSISVLAGLGISSIERNQVDKKSLKKILRSSISLMGLMVIWAIIVCHYFLEKNKNTIAVNIIYFLNITILPSLAIFFMGWVSLNFYAKRRSVPAAISLLIVLVIDLSSFGWFYEWQAGPVSSTLLSTPIFLEKYQKKLEQQHQRFFPLQGALSSVSQAPPNLSRIWNAPSISGYGPLLVSRFGEFMSLAPYGALVSKSVLLDNQNLSLDLSGVRYITTVAQSESLSLAPNDSTKWEQEDLAISLGKTCVITSREDVTIELPEPMEIDSIHLIATLGCSTTITQGTNVLEVMTIDVDSNVESHFLKAGQDLSEAAINRPDVAAQVKHQVAKIFKQTPIPGETWLSNQYVTQTILTKPSTVRQIRIRLPAENISAVMINKISLNNSRTKTSYPLLSGRWRYVEDIGDARIYENRNVMPRAWLTSQVQSVPPDQILAAVKTSKLPNGSVFNPRQTALIEESIDFSTQIPDPTATVQVEFPSETQVRLQTKSTQPSFLVLSDVFYPGWQAHIDGKPAHIFQTNYIFRGVQLPTGEHTVTFSFRPLSFAIGCGISAASFALLIYIVVNDCRYTSESRPDIGE